MASDRHPRADHARADAVFDAGACAARSRGALAGAAVALPQGTQAPFVCRVAAPPPTEAARPAVTAPPVRGTSAVPTLSQAARPGTVRNPFDDTDRDSTQ